MTRLVALLAALAIALTGCGESDTQKRFRQECSERGGFVAKTKPGGIWFASWVDCIVDGKIVYMPGFA